MKLKRFIYRKFLTFKGYPESLGLDEFERRFSMFRVGLESSGHDHQRQQSVMALIRVLDLDAALYKLGNTQVLYSHVL